ncbi:MAG: helix-turn-helix domain-containing protein [Enterococcus sp.]
MRHALSSTKNRQINIIQILRTANNYVSIKQLAESVNAVPKTVVSDCLEIEDQWGDIVQIEKSASGEFRLSEKDNHSVHEIFSAILKESPTFQLLELLFFQPGKLRTDLEKELFLSSSSLYRRIVKLNEGLGERGLQIDRNQLRLIGHDERQLRIFMASYFTEVYDVYDWPFPLNQAAIVKAANYLNESFNLNLTFIQKTEFSFLLAVSLIRQEQGFFSHQKRTMYTKNHLEFYQPSVTHGLAHLDLHQSKHDQCDLIQTIFWPNLAWDNQEEEDRITRLCDATITTIIEALGITISHQSRIECVDLLKMIYTSYKVYPYEKHVAYNRELYNSLTIQRDFMVFSKVLMKTLKTLEAKVHFPWYSLYYHSILFELFIYWNDLPEKLATLRQPVKVEVCSDLGIKHAQLLAHYFKNNYPGKISLDIQAEKVYANVAQESLISDLYITNFSTPIIPEKKLFVIEDVPSTKSLSALSKRIEDHRMNNLIGQLSYLN